MGLVSKVIPGLYNGISQQSPTIRLDTQGELQENALGTLVDGLIKRPPTEFIALLESLVSENSFIHIIDRDKDEKYIMVVTGNSDNPIEIFTLDGVKCTVQYGTLDEDLVFTENTNIKNYLVSSSPKESIKTVTALDYTIISNSAKSTAMSEQPTANTIPQVVFYVQKGVLSTTYNIWVNDTKVASYTSSDSSSTYRTIDIAQSLYTQMLSNLPNNSLVITYKSTYLHYYPDSTTYVGSIVPALNISITDPDGNVLTYSKAGVDRYHETDIQGSVLAQEVYDALNSLLSKKYWEVKIFGTTVIISRVGGAAFSCIATGPTITLPSGSSQWIVNHPNDSRYISLKRIDGADFTYRVSDSYSDQALMGFKNSIQKFTNLPSVCESGFTLEISGDDDDQFNNWYVKYVNESSLSTGIWKETVKPGLDNAFNPLTMPHRLVRTGENVFTFAPIIWSERKVGDTDSAPEPSFIELPIQSVFFHKNRLGFLSKDNVILSTAGDYFNFWPSTALDILDDDPIDVAANSDKAITLRNAISLPNGLLMTSDEQHFVLSSGDDLLTPKTASIEPASTIDTESLSQPVAAGSTFFFVSPKGSYSGIREYYAQSEVIATDSADITAHVPKYIPKNITSLAVNPNYDILLALSSNELNNLYVYKYQWQGEEKVQSAWSLWSFDDDIIDIKSIGSYIYLLTKKDNQVALLRLNLDIVDSSSLDFKVHLDKQTTVTGVYNIATNKTTWTLPYNDTSDIFEVINLSNGLAINTTKISNNQLQATGDYSTIECLVGKNYTKRYRLSEWYYRTQESNVANLDANIQLRKMIVSYEDSGYFRVEVTPYRRTLVSFKDLINSRIIGSSKIGQPSITSGEASVMVLGPSIGTSIDIINDTYLPSKITSITLEGLLIQHSNPI